MLARTIDVLQAAQIGNYAVAAFNVYSLETVQAAIHVAERERQPVILALGERYFPTVDVEGFSALAKTLAEKATVPVCLHLDHAYEQRSILRAIRNGFTSVMYDGSKYDLETNIRHTREVVKMAHAADVAVEAEIGSVVRGAYSDEEEGDGTMTDPRSAKAFVAATGVDFLAVAIGTVHGLYRGEPDIRLDLLDRIRREVAIPLVLHGGSGTPEDVLRQAIQFGICKINVNTEVSIAAAAYLENGIRHPQWEHLSTLMADMQRAIEPVMTKFVQLFAKPASSSEFAVK